MGHLVGGVLVLTATKLLYEDIQHKRMRETFVHFALAAEGQHRGGVR